MTTISQLQFHRHSLRTIAWLFFFCTRPVLAVTPEEKIQLITDAHDAIRAVQSTSFRPELAAKNHKKLEEIAKRNPDAFTYQERSRLPGTQACYFGNLEAFEIMANASEKVFTAANHLGETPASIALRDIWVHLPLIKFIVERAPETFFSVNETTGSTPVHRVMCSLGETAIKKRDQEVERSRSQWDFGYSSSTESYREALLMIAKAVPTEFWDTKNKFGISIVDVADFCSVDPDFIKQLKGAHLTLR